MPRADRGRQGPDLGVGLCDREARGMGRRPPKLVPGVGECGHRSDGAIRLGDQSAGIVGFQTCRGIAACESVNGVTRPNLPLAHDGVEASSGDGVIDEPKCRARPDGLQLAIVTDEKNGSPRRVDMGEKPFHLPARHQPGLIDDQEAGRPQHRAAVLDRCQP